MTIGARWGVACPQTACGLITKEARLIFRSIGLILSGNLSGAIITMVRTLLVSRLISLEDFGIASIFVLAMSLVEMMSALGFQQQMIQSKDGNALAFQSALQGFAMLRGLANGLILMVLAQPLANFFGIPEVAWAFRTIALAPIMIGFTHFDAGRLSRQMKFLPSVLVSTLPPIGSLISVFPFYWAFGDYRTLLFAILVHMFLVVLTSHLVAERKYRLIFDRAVMARSLRFGWPLMASGVLMYIVFNGERIIIGRELSLEALALFSMALSLTLTPSLVIAKSTMSFFLPQLSAAIGKDPYPGLAMTTFQCHLMLGNVMLVGIALVGGPFLYAVLGEKYAAAIPLMTWLGVVQALRVYKGGCSVVAFAGGFTKNEVMANIVRVSLLPLAWFLVAQGGDLLTLIWIGMAGEMAGLLIGLLLARRQQAVSLRALLVPLAISATLMMVACLHAQIQVGWAPDRRTSIALLVLLVLSVISLSDLRGYVRRRTISGHQEES